MDEWTDGMLWALAKKVRARAREEPPNINREPVQSDLPLGYGGNVIELRRREKERSASFQSDCADISKGAK